MQLSCWDRIFDIPAGRPLSASAPLHHLPFSLRVDPFRTPCTEEWWVKLRWHRYANVYEMRVLAYLQCTPKIHRSKLVQLLWTSLDVYTSLYDTFGLKSMLSRLRNATTCIQWLIQLLSSKDQISEKQIVYSIHLHKTTAKQFQPGAITMHFCTFASISNGIDKFARLGNNLTRGKENIWHSGFIGMARNASISCFIFG